MPNQQDKARHLAALEAALAAELTSTRTMMLAVASTHSPTQLEAAVSAWVQDWKDYHISTTSNPIARAAIPVAVDHVSAQRVAAAVWHLQHQQWENEPAQPQTHTEPHTPAAKAAPSAMARVRAVPPEGKYAPVEIEIDGSHVRVAACVNDVLWDIANGKKRLKFRPETLRKLRQCVPWVADALKRDHSAKVLSNRHTYEVPDSLTTAVDGTSSGTSARTA